MQIPTATPRRLVNHRDVSATRGANVAEVPNKPINKPCTKLNQPIPPDKPAATSPALKPTVPTARQVATPNRSDNRPIQMPPRPKPTITNVYGSEAAARSTPKAVDRKSTRLNSSH